MKTIREQHETVESRENKIAEIKSKGGKYSYYGLGLTYSFDANLTIDSLLGNQVIFTVYNETIGRITPCDLDFIKEQVNRALESAYFPWTEFHNIGEREHWDKVLEGFNKGFVSSKLSNLDETLNEMFWIERVCEITGIMNVSMLRKGDEYDKWAKEFMLNSDFVHKDLRKSYIDFIREYSGVIL